jgi:hypothetical protein
MIQPIMRLAPNEIDVNSTEQIMQIDIINDIPYEFAYDPETQLIILTDINGTITRFSNPHINACDAMKLIGHDLSNRNVYSNTAIYMNPDDKDEFYNQSNDDVEYLLYTPLNRLSLSQITFEMFTNTNQ